MATTKKIKPHNKVIFLGDTHFGASKGNDDRHEYMKLFFEDFFAYIDKNEIRYIVQVGDLFDVRKNVDIKVIKFFRSVFLDEITKRNINLYVIVGNHDIYYKETVKVNTVHELLRDYQMLYSNLTIIDSPKNVTIGEHDFLLVPWVCNDNIEEVAQAVRTSKSKYCAGHFEFNGFEMSRGHSMTTKHSHHDYGKFDLVISGHYHTKSKKDNVIYTGTPYQLTWMDYDDAKGFWVFQDGDMKFVENKHTIYNKIWYSDGFAPAKSEVYKKYVHVIMTERIDKKDHASYVNTIQLMEPLDIKVIERFDEQLSQETYVHDILQTDDLLKSYVNDSQIDLDKQKMTDLLLSLYREALKNE